MNYKRTCLYCGEFNDNLSYSCTCAEGGDSMEATRAVLESGGFEAELHTSDLREALINFLEFEEHLAVHQQVIPEPASLTSLAAVTKVQQRNGLSPDDIVVSISTGDGQKAKHLLLSLLTNEPILKEKLNQIIDKDQKFSAPSFTEKGRKIHSEANVEALTQAFHRMQKLPA